MNANRALRNNVFMAVHDFLEDHYDCDCPRIDPDGSHTAEALELTHLILGIVDPQEIWEDGYSSGAGDNYSGTPVGEIDPSLEDEGTSNPYEDIDTDRLRAWLRDATVYAKSMEHLSEREDL